MPAVHGATARSQQRTARGQSEGFFDEEIATYMERFVTLVEPVLLVVMGIVIAGLLLALYMPLFQLSSVLAQ